MNYRRMYPIFFLLSYNAIAVYTTMKMQISREPNPEFDDAIPINSPPVIGITSHDFGGILIADSTRAQILYVIIITVFFPLFG